MSVPSDSTAPASVRRVMGLESEFGIAVPGEPYANPMHLSGLVVTTYARAHGHRATHGAWDYSDESPLVDARGFTQPRASAHPSQLTDEDDPSLANVVLGNGARLYVDHAHPEYSSPEVTTPRDALIWDRAGDLVAREVVARLADRGRGVNLYKNNTDGKGSSYGTHENYQVDRTTPFAQIVRHLLPFFVARQVMCGAGRVGLGRESERAGYQISSRADFFEAEVGLETTFKRPIINTRDEPHADAERWRRLHVIVGDANLAEVAGLLKVGSTSLVLALIERDGLSTDLMPRYPIAALQQISHDPSCQALIEVRDGRSLTAVQMLWEYFEAATALVTKGGGADGATAEVLGHWERVLTLLERDPMLARADIDWVAKLALLQQYRERDGLAWDDPRLRAIDIQWADVRAERGLHYKLEAAGRITRLTTDEEVIAAMTMPPSDTRAWARGHAVTTYPRDVLSASWDCLVIDQPARGGVARVTLPDPLRGSRAALAPHVGAAQSVEAFVDALAKHA